MIYATYSNKKLLVESAITMVMIPQEEWQSLNDKLDRLAEMIENRNATDLNAEWLESEATLKLLGVSPKTWQNYRDSASSHSPK